MLRLLVPSIVACLAVQATAQTYGNIWQFGYNVGLDFSECDPHVIVTGNNAGFEGCATVCDELGAVCFYTNSETVWNADNVPMPSGTLVPSGGSLSQVLIVRVPESTSLYYIVTTTLQAQAPGRLRYHVVDMTEDGGDGDVVSEDNVLFDGTSTEQVAATLHANGTDVWIMAHAYPGNQFLAYLLTPDGITTTPVVSDAGPSLLVGSSNMNTRGEIKFSLAGDKLAMACNGVGNDNATNTLTLCDFDASTGVVSNAIDLPCARGDFGISFSPGGTKLYGASWKAFNFTAADNNSLYQFDLSSDDPATIIASYQTLYTAPISEPFGSLKLGPDGRIYVGGNNRTHLGVINEPDEAGAGCNYVNNGLYLNGALSSYGLNNYIEYVDCHSIPTAVPATSASNDVRLFPNPAQGSISITGPTQGGILHLVDAAGRTAMQHPVVAGEPIALDDLPPGGYAATIFDTDGRSLLHTPLIVVP